MRGPTDTDREERTRRVYLTPIRCMTDDQTGYTCRQRREKQTQGHGKAGKRQKQKRTLLGRRRKYCADQTEFSRRTEKKKDEDEEDEKKKKKKKKKGKIGKSTHVR